MDDEKVKTIFSNNLKKYMNMVGVNQNDIAKITGVSQQSVSNWINRKQIPRMGIIERLADYFGILKSDLLEDKDDVSNGIKIPILGTVIAGIPVTAVEDIIGYEEINEKTARCGDCFALEIKGDSMEPKMSKGDIVIVKQQNTVENGQIAIVLVNGDEATVKKVRFRDNGIELIAFNSYVYEPHFYSAKEKKHL